MLQFAAMILASVIASLACRDRPRSTRTLQAWAIASNTACGSSTARGGLAVFNLAIDSRLYCCNVVADRVNDVVSKRYSMHRVPHRKIGTLATRSLKTDRSGVTDHQRLLALGEREV